MKKITALLLVALMMLSLTACGVGDLLKSAAQEELPLNVSVLNVVTMDTGDGDLQVNVYTPYRAEWIADDVLGVYAHADLYNGSDQEESVFLYSEKGTYLAAYSYGDQFATVDLLYGIDPALYIPDGEDNGSLEFMQGDEFTYSNGAHRVRERNEEGIIIRDVLTDGAICLETRMDAGGNVISTTMSERGELLWEYQYEYMLFPVPEK